MNAIKRATARVACALILAPAAARAQDSTRVPGYWHSFAMGFVSSILVHEGGHIGTALALGKRPTFGFDTGRPTIYSGINALSDPHDQFLFSSAGLNAQTILDEVILDVPHSRGSPFERGVLAGGIGTTLFYLTIGRSGSVSDVAYMARTHGMTKTQSTIIYGGVAALQTLRIVRDWHYADFFMRPSADGKLLVGANLATSGFIR